MKSLNELIGKKVYIELVDEENCVHAFPATVLNVFINDFYYVEKGEPIYIEVNIGFKMEDVKDLPEEFDIHDLATVPLSYLRYGGE